MFNGSQLQKSIINEQSKDKLSKKETYIDIAIEHWTKEGDQEQISFFKEAQQLIQSQS